MQREYERPRTMKPDGLKEQGEDNGDADHKDFNLRTQRASLARGRYARDAPALVQGTAIRNKEQVRRFAKLIAKPDEARPVEANIGASAKDHQVEPLHFAAQPEQPVIESALQQEEQTDVRERHERFTDGDVSSQESALRHEHAPRFTQSRPGRGRSGGESASPKGTLRGAPLSPDAAKYMPHTPPDEKSGSSGSPTRRMSKLQFSAEEAIVMPDATPPDKKKIAGEKKLEKAKSKAERVAKQFETAQKNLPIKHSSHIANPVKAGASTAVGYMHTKTSQAEHENVGTQAAHKGEIAAEGGFRRIYLHHKKAPYRKTAKLEQRAARFNMKVSYRQALHENPELKSNVLSRMAQKRKIKKQYAKAHRDGQKAAQYARKATAAPVKAAEAAFRTVTRHPAIFGMIGVLFLFMIAISSFFTSCSGIVSGIGVSIIASSYVAEDADIDNAELSYTEWEASLQMQINRVENDYPSYDEYRYQTGGIGHDPYELMAYLTATHYDFKYHEIEAVLRQIFAEQYQLTFTPSVETRYADPTDSNDDGDYEAYDWHILTVKLVSRSFADVITARLDEKQLQHYSLLMQSKGNRQYVKSPFDFDWSHHVTSRYGYRVHPISGTKDYHKGIDIAVPVGTEIEACHDGTVTYAGYSGGYGYVVVLEDGKGLTTKYAHCDFLLVSEGQSIMAGDVIASSGNSGNSTGPHLHFEVIKNGQYLNPLYFSRYR